MSPPTKAVHKVSHTLTVTQRRMYASEKMVNFRWISKILATHSSYTLTAADLASVDLHIGLAEIGKYVQLNVSLDSIFLIPRPIAVVLGQVNLQKWLTAQSRPSSFFRISPLYSTPISR